MLSVFLVDDEALIRRGLKKLIPWEQHGFQIAGEADNGLEALKQITSDNTDIVMVDMKMPVMDGLELCTLIKESYPGIKFIVLTAYDDFEYMRQSIRTGVTDYILKPVNASILLESLLRLKKRIEDERTSYPFEWENDFIEAVIAGNSQLSREMMNSLSDEMNKHKVKVYDTCQIVRNILRALNHRLESSGSSLKDILRKDILGDAYFAGYSTNNMVFEELSCSVQGVMEHRSGIGSHPKLIREMKEYIEKHIGDDLSLNTLAKAFYTNPSYLSHLFKHSTGENYSEYLSRIRVEKAKRLLEDSHFKVQDVSEMVGYTDSRYFSQMFKKIAGLTPTEYRNQSVQDLKKVSRE